MKSTRRVIPVLILSLMIFVLTGALWSKPVEAASTVISIIPVNAPVTTCSDTVISVWVENVTDLYSYDINLTYSPGIKIVSVTNGNLLDSSLGYEFYKLVDETNREIFYSFGYLTDIPGETGSGALVYITVRATSPGQTVTINYGDFNYLSDTNSDSIDFTTTPGSVVTSECPPTTLTIFPNSGTACTTGDTTVSVWVNNVIDLYSYDLRLTFDPDVIRITGVTNGTFLTTTPFVPGSGYDNTLGTMTYVMTQRYPATPKTGSGSLLTITFSTLASGRVTTLNIDDVNSALANSEFAFIDFTATDGVIYTSTCDPNAVELMSFDVVRRKLKATLTWETASEINNAGFNLYRAGRPDGALKKINKELIPAKEAGSLMGAEYVYLIKPLNPWRTYYYWLETVDLNGETNLYGPVEAEPPLK